MSDADWLAGRLAALAADPRYRRVLDGSNPPPAPPGPCRFRGDPLTALECVALGLPPARSWAPCGHPDQPNGVYVCPCKGCGTACVGYSSETNEV